MNLIINGKPVQADQGATLKQLLTMLAVEPDGIAVEINGSIIPANSYTATSLDEGDHIEIIQFVGGG